MKVAEVVQIREFCESCDAGERCTALKITDTKETDEKKIASQKNVHAARRTGKYEVRAAQTLPNNFTCIFNKNNDFFHAQLPEY